MNNSYHTLLIAKMLHAERIKDAAAYRKAKALRPGKPSLWQTLENRFRKWRPAPAKQEEVLGSLKAGKTA